MVSTIGIPISIGVIICTTRKPRVCPQVADFVIDTIESNPISSPDITPYKLNLIDLETWNLPMFNEPTIPSQIKDYTQYVKPHTRAWSQEIQKHSAFIFVTPQYNSGYPAAIKNAIDYLFNEWTGKPAIIVSYGSHGGGKAAVQLKGVLDGCRMRLVEKMPALKFPSREVVVAASRGEKLLMSGHDGIWEEERDGIRGAFVELIALLSET
jgi:NAD(P)H-dependent FMN reductase